MTWRKHPLLYKFRAHLAIAYGVLATIKPHPFAQLVPLMWVSVIALYLTDMDHAETAQVRREQEGATDGPTRS